MTATGPAFDPARSAILRDILHETVATAPARPSRTRFALVGGLVGAAVLLAGGTAALALSGALHFGPQEPPPVPPPTQSATSTPTPTPTPAPAPAPAANDAQQLIQKACTDFGATFEEKIDIKFPHQESATGAAQQAAQLDPQWEPIADDMSLITSIGERLNILHDPTLTLDEDDKANRAVAALQQKCTAAGGAFQLPPD